jgi:hypothetical protein
VCAGQGPSADAAVDPQDVGLAHVVVAVHSVHRDNPDSAPWSLVAEERDSLDPRGLSTPLHAAPNFTPFRGCCAKPKAQNGRTDAGTAGRDRRPSISEPDGSDMASGKWRSSLAATAESAKAWGFLGQLPSRRTSKSVEEFLVKLRADGAAGPDPPLMV